MHSQGDGLERTSNLAEIYYHDPSVQMRVMRKFHEKGNCGNKSYPKIRLVMWLASRLLADRIKADDDDFQAPNPNRRLSICGLADGSGGTSTPI